jgi:hypothetical protein
MEIRKDDLFQPVEKEVSETETIYYSVGYTGSPKKSLESDHMVCAKTISLGKNTHYFIRTDMNKKLYDPFGLYNNLLHRQPQITFRKVNKETFDLYYKYLSTKNRAWFSNAERTAE